MYASLGLGELIRMTHKYHTAIIYIFPVVSFKLFQMTVLFLPVIWIYTTNFLEDYNLVTEKNTEFASIVLMNRIISPLNEIRTHIYSLILGTRFPISPSDYRRSIPSAYSAYVIRTKRNTGGDDRHNYPSIKCHWAESTTRVTLMALQWRHNGGDGVSNHHPDDCLLDRLFRCRSKKTSKLRFTGLCAGNSPVTGECPAQTASNAENVSIWWSHHGKGRNIYLTTRVVCGHRID